MPSQTIKRKKEPNCTIFIFFIYKSCSVRLTVFELLINNDFYEKDIGFFKNIIKGNWYFTVRSNQAISDIGMEAIKIILYKHTSISIVLGGFVTT